MSVGYAKDEMVSASVVARSFGRILGGLANHKRQRVVVVKNNRMEAVILPVDAYEKLSELAELVEHIEIYALIGKRKDKDTGRRIGLSTLLKEERIVL